MRKLVWIVGMVLASGLAAAAQETPKADVFLGYSYGRIRPQSAGTSNFNINGGTGSIAWNLNDSFGIVADLAGYRVGKINGLDPDSTAFTYLFGPRFSFRRSKKVTPFAQFLIGGARVSENLVPFSASQNSLAMTVGGGVDANLSRHLALRIGQVEYFLTRFPEIGIDRQTQNNLRFSTGIVFRF